jgi:hypothetical protein
MATHQPTSSASSPPHPAPARHTVSNFALGFGLLAAPFAWAVDEMALYFVASRLCEMKTYNVTETLARATSPWFIAISVVAFIVALAGVWVACDSWRRSRNEKEGSGHHLVEVGEGRTRFLAMTGMVTSIGFAIAFLFIFSQMFVAPLC